MGEKLKGIPWLQLLWPTIIAVIFYAYTANVKATIHEELKSYVTQYEFDSYRTGHKENLDEVKKSIDKRFDLLEIQGRENNRLLLELMRRRNLNP